MSATVSSTAIDAHNLAAGLGDAERFAEAEVAARRALALGGDAPETWLVLARALHGQDQAQAAEAAFRQALVRRPVFEAAHRELAQLIWMRSADLAAASAPLDAALTHHPDEAALLRVKAELLDYAGPPGAALALLEAHAARAEASPDLLIAASQAALRLDPGKAVAWAERATAAVRGSGLGLGTLGEAYLAAGRADLAVAVAEDMLHRDRFDQRGLCLLATAWRILGDPRQSVLNDYERLVSARFLDTPSGWSSLTDYLADLAVALRALHPYKSHPLGQSLRHGSQTSQSLRQSADPAIKAFAQAADGPIRRHLAAVGAGGHPFSVRNTGDYAYAGQWSVRLQPGGYHVDHIHPRGWLSSACYIALPPAVEAGGREGWLQFGRPGTPTAPDLPPEHFIKPQPGLLALFPSYMWHGTVPFSGEADRLTIAFDLAPAAR